MGTLSNYYGPSEGWIDALLEITLYYSRYNRGHDIRKPLYRKRSDGRWAIIHDIRPNAIRPNGWKAPTELDLLHVRSATGWDTVFGFAIGNQIWEVTPCTWFPRAVIYVHRGNIALAHQDPVAGMNIGDDRTGMVATAVRVYDDQTQQFYYGTREAWLTLNLDVIRAHAIHFTSMTVDFGFATVQAASASGRARLWQMLAPLPSVDYTPGFDYRAANDQQVWSFTTMQRVSETDVLASSIGGNLIKDIPILTMPRDQPGGGPLADEQASTATVTLSRQDVDTNRYLMFKVEVEPDSGDPGQWYVRTSPRLKFYI